MRPLQHDVEALGFGSIEACHLLLETMKLAFEDRNASTGDPDFLHVPVDRIMSKEYAQQRGAVIDMCKARPFRSDGPVECAESNYTTNIAVADNAGNVVEMTQTINSLFGCGAMLPGCGIMLNNTQSMFDPHPGQPHSVAPGKRVTSSMAPTIVLCPDGRPFCALGLPGGIRIFTSVLQALINVIDHKMSPQAAVEAPRLWTQGAEVVLERTFAPGLRKGLEAKGHRVGPPAPTVGGGMSLIRFEYDTPGSTSMTGACCWRADGTPMGVGGGFAEAGARFSTGTEIPKL
jgi:gamma-glutamyltranspeptidase/glutathione hydrolase